MEVEVDKFYFNVRMQIVSEHSDREEIERQIVNQLSVSPFLQVEVDSIHNARPNIDHHVDSLRESHIRRLASIFENGGSFLITNHTEDGITYKKLRMEIQKTDFATMQFVASMLGTTLGSRIRGTKTPSWVAQSVGSRALALIHRMWPYFSRKRQMYINSVLELIGEGIE